jgi:RNA polymerase sigma-70 factor (ECF subfamily)
MLSERESRTLVPPCEVENFPTGTDVLIPGGTDKQFDEPHNDIIDRAQKGDQDALATLYGLYQPRIYPYSLARLGNVQDAEDATSGIFIKLITSLEDFKWRGPPFSAWLFRIARNHIVDIIRRDAIKRGQTLPLGEALRFVGCDGGFSSIEDHMDSLMRLEKVTVACRQLSPACNEVISLRFFAGLSVRDTARVLGKKEDNVKVIQHKAIDRLRKILNGEVSVEMLYMRVLNVFLQSDGDPIRTDDLAKKLSIKRRTVYGYMWRLRRIHNIPFKTDLREGYYLEKEDIKKLRREF